jgi:hypothetical protein
MTGRAKQFRRVFRALRIGVLAIVFAVSCFDLIAPERVEAFFQNGSPAEPAASPRPAPALKPLFVRRDTARV